MNYPDKVCLVEVGPRDGLQNEATIVGIEHGVDLPLLLDASRYISEQLQRDTQSRAARALMAAQSVTGP